MFYKAPITGALVGVDAEAESESGTEAPLL